MCYSVQTIDINWEILYKMSSLYLFTGNSRHFPSKFPHGGKYKMVANDISWLLSMTQTNDNKTHQADTDWLDEWMDAYRIGTGLN